ncbi:hypothetical protein PYW08_005534 [Mythimna loreyi]|uniref:Uncharacterized protein n=1 Tax=Mythimna loreyi TaxID=667449 RepID=A0ACC2QGY5_9NEOP|nr:hypothetical protein PYW08_005534 [Mythimna loreyi]
MSQEPLQIIPPEKWGELQSAFKKDWPRGAPAHSVLVMQKQWLDRGVDYEFKVYCPFGDVQNGMVALSEKNPRYEVIIQCPNDNVENLYNALRETKIIDWKKSPLIPYAPKHIIKLIKNILEDTNIGEAVEIGLIFPAGIFILETKKPYGDVNLPTGITFELLTNKYVDIVDSTWSLRYPSSSTYFELLINNKCGYGLFLNNALICWLFVSEAGVLRHLYTVKEYRQKGYAELLLKLVCNVLIEEGLIVTSYCLKDNCSAIKLHNKVGFIEICDVEWCRLRSMIN